MPREEYKDIVPPAIDPKHPERLNVFFPIRLKEGSGERKIVVEKKRIERFSLTGGDRIINLKINYEKNTASFDGQFPVMDNYVIKEGLRPGDRLIASASGMIIRGTDKPDENGVINLKNGGFRIKTKDDKGNESVVGFGGSGLKLKLTKEVPASPTVRIGPNEFDTVENFVPITEGEEIGIMVEVGKDPDINGQALIVVQSTVTGEDGRTQGGPAEVMPHITPEGKLIIPK